MIDFDAYMKEISLIAALTQEGLELEEAAIVLAHAIQNDLCISSSLIKFINEWEEEGNLTSCEEYDDAAKQAICNMMNKMVNPFSYKKSQ